MRLTEKQYQAILKHNLDYKISKYKAQKTKIDGIVYDSKKEAQMGLKLANLERLGVIKNLQRQPKFLLIDTIRYKGKTFPKTYYIADFQYTDVKTGKTKIIDVKSEFTRKDKVYRLKLKLLLSKYPEIEFEEII